MPNFAILRLSKLRTLAAVAAAGRHNARLGTVHAHAGAGGEGNWHQ
jgi:hypothetical protein